MGCSFSCKASKKFDGVRVIHINGYVEDFEAPVTVAQVTGKPPKHVLFSSAQMLSMAVHPLRPDHLLEPGRLYFLLPHTVFQSDSSPIDLALLATRLTTLARRGGSGVALSPSAIIGGVGGGRVMTRAWRPELDTIEEKSIGRSMRTSSMSSTHST